MADIEKIKHGVILICDCGATHKIITDTNGEIILKSSYQKKQNEKGEEKRGKETEDESSPSLFD